MLLMGYATPGIGSEVWDWWVGSTQDPWYGALLAREARMLAKRALLSSWVLKYFTDFQFSCILQETLKSKEVHCPRNGWGWQDLLDMLQAGVNFKHKTKKRHFQILSLGVIPTKKSAYPFVLIREYVVLLSNFIPCHLESQNGYQNPIWTFQTTFSLLFYCCCPGTKRDGGVIWNSSWRFKVPTIPER